MMYEEYRDRVGELITGIVQQSDSRYTLVQLRERVEALLPKSEQVDGERYDHSQRIKAVIKEVSPSTKGPSIIVSRRDPELIKKLFELEVPEIADGLVEIANVAREPGYRSKIAVVSYADGVDPVGACVGPRGSRVRMVVSAILGNGRRCPNAALPGSRFCGLDSHQALEGTGTVYVAGEPPAELVGENGEVEEAVAEEALAGGLESPEANDGLVEEAVAGAPV